MWTPALNESVPMVGAPLVWPTTGGGAGSSVAVLDSGVDSSHPAVAGRIRAEACFSTPRPGGRSACPGGGTHEIGPGSASACTGSQECWHGTRVAAIAAGSDNPVSGAGVAPGAGIVAVQVGNHDVEGRFSVHGADVIKALEWLYAARHLHDVKVVNLSMGEGGYLQACDDHPVRSAVLLLRSVDIVTVAATGNDGFVNAVAAPAFISELVAVGASTRNGTVAFFSNAHPSLVDLHGPGTDILAAVPGGYARMSGPSMASPHVAPAFALLAAAPEPGSLGARIRSLRETGLTILDDRAWPPVEHPMLAIDRASAPLLQDGEGCTRAPFRDVGVDHRFCVAIASGAESAKIPGLAGRHLPPPGARQPPSGGVPSVPKGRPTTGHDSDPVR